MKLSTSCVALLVSSASGFLPLHTTPTTSLVLKGYLDELNGEAMIQPEEEVEEDDSRDATKMAKAGVDRGGVGDWSQFVDFDEFDGGDGQMGVAGDGNKKLEAFDMSSMAKSKSMSAKNAWGTSTGYADKLIDEGIEGQRAQQLENWRNQQEVLSSRKDHKFMTDEFDNTSGDEGQWDLSKFGVERNQDFDMDEVLGAVAPGGSIDGVIELSANMNQNAVHQFNLKNEFMGFADFRAAFTADTPPYWTIEPEEGSLDKKGTDFTLRFRPNTPQTVEGYLVIETEDFKKTYHLIGGTS